MNTLTNLSYDLFYSYSTRRSPPESFWRTPGREIFVEYSSKSPKGSGLHPPFNYLRRLRDDNTVAPSDSDHLTKCCKFLMSYLNSKSCRYLIIRNMNLSMAIIYNPDFGHSCTFFDSYKSYSSYILT